jgi:hypothetical protein
MHLDVNLRQLRENPGKTGLQTCGSKGSPKSDEICRIQSVWGKLQHLLERLKYQNIETALA